MGCYRGVLKMEVFKLVSKQKNNLTKLNAQTQVVEYAQLSEAELLKLFPLPRYFQVHFQYIHENADAFKTELSEIKSATLQLNEKLDLLMQLLTQPTV